MKINTKYQGIVEVNEAQMIHFENGIPGFFQEKQFVVLTFSEGTPFFILQSIKTSSLAFVITDPFSFYNNYNFEISDAVTAQLNIHSEKNVSVFVVLTVHNPFERTTANLQAPLVINNRSQRGKQIVLDDGPYGTRHLLVTPTSSLEQEG